MKLTQREIAHVRTLQHQGLTNPAFLAHYVRDYRRSSLSRRYPPLPSFTIVSDDGTEMYLSQPADGSLTITVQFYHEGQTIWLTQDQERFLRKILDMRKR